MRDLNDRAAAREPGSRAAAVRTTGLSKRYGRDAIAVDALDLDVPHGAVYGFLGPNGSGKTTTIRMLLGLIEPSGGHCELLGHAMPAAATRVLPHVGVMVDGPAFHPGLSGGDNLRRLDAADRTAPRGDTRARVDAALSRVGLAKAARKPFRGYSLGMKQRLAIAAALLRPRRLLILDEPTNGLDPQGTREVRALIAELAAEGLTVLLSTHLLSEVEQMCDHVGIMHRGRLMVQGTLNAVRSGVPTRVRVDSRDPAAVARRLRELGLGVADPSGETAPTTGGAAATGADTGRGSTSADLGFAAVAAGGADPGRGPTPTAAGEADATTRRASGQVASHAAGSDHGAAANRAAAQVTAELAGLEPEKVLSTLVGDGIPVREFRILEPTLEEVFIALTGEGFDDYA